MTRHMGSVLSADQKPAKTHTETVETTATRSSTLSLDIPLETARLSRPEVAPKLINLSCDSHLFWCPTQSTLKFREIKDPCLCYQSSFPTSQILDHQQQFLTRFI